jgi:hypothetical protein
MLPLKLVTLSEAGGTISDSLHATKIKPEKSSMMGFKMFQCSLSRGFF